MSLLFPSTCILCNTPSKRNLDLCVACEAELPIIKQIYLSNAMSFSARIFALYHYQAPIQQLILGVKFNNRLVNAKILGELLASYLCDQYRNQDKPEIIIPVPLHPKRLRERGYNQALELARPVAKKLKIQINKSAVERIKNTLAQAVLPAKNRAQNLKQAFSINANSLRGYKHVAVIDDVITTGNTAAELCKTLYQEGIHRIDIWCLAKTL